MHAPLLCSAAVLLVIVLVTGCERPTVPTAAQNEPKETTPAVTQIKVAHVKVTTAKPYADATAAFLAQVGKYDATVAKDALASADAAAARRKLEKMAGPSEFMIFAAHDHGAVLTLVGQKRKAVQYILGNALFAVEMTRHDVRASLYAPLRVLIYESDDGKTCIEYDRPSSLFGQFGNAQVDQTANMLDQKLEELVSLATQ
ncbi:DUF302 domain-containing protein [Frigoriglobus tundricola]|uniref:DUF302 domain-containing protein n=1 Tax=Frigoriglobus tundricola TaxID=2774151 RepID=A0A6M5Z4B6_9BACT|nr:DUF302 domain-containing protein [Frigoriglobus tundricola]QJX00936.1 hypothetical protein FTUN_8574 [Frigoriglobus tundricola]